MKRSCERDSELPAYHYSVMGQGKGRYEMNNVSPGNGFAKYIVIRFCEGHTLGGYKSVEERNGKLVHNIAHIFFFRRRMPRAHYPDLVASVLKGFCVTSGGNGEAVVGIKKLIEYKQYFQLSVTFFAAVFLVSAFSGDDSLN